MSSIRCRSLLRCHWLRSLRQKVAGEICFSANLPERETDLSSEPSSLSHWPARALQIQLSKLNKINKSLRFRQSRILRLDKILISPQFIRVNTV
ncbi:hypothetical protein SKAU_G00339080 [Synaphobranchus kaupii]|uniref:Uncharacterized protein n=1 Tax=Synaphobranchus kaupii TaxID=118154 RepID=A0A9Q1EMT5_SYNKA|nr:hypothetical protein SKAU_G00339080 [Synaphobranchus kaupii]